MQRGNPRIDVKIALFFNPLDKAVVKVNKMANELLPRRIDNSIKLKFSTGLPNHKVKIK